MSWKRRIGQPTKAEQSRQDQARALGCVACWQRGLIEYSEDGTAYTPAGRFEIHHITINGFTQSQDQSVCLCSHHHRGQCLPRHTSSMMCEKFGPALSKGSKPFAAAFGDAPTILEFQNALIARAISLRAA